uniref:Replicase polyprotein 1ab n=1 Tax=Yellow head virus TaxID=96029 RepID=F2Q6X0_YHV|nr:replicase polyprotein 1ab [Yellow head virus]
MEPFQVLSLLATSFSLLLLLRILDRGTNVLSAVRLTLRTTFFNESARRPLYWTSPAKWFNSLGQTTPRMEKRSIKSVKLSSAHGSPYPSVVTLTIIANDAYDARAFYRSKQHATQAILWFGALFNAGQVLCGIVLSLFALTYIMVAKLTTRLRKFLQAVGATRSENLSCSHFEETHGSKSSVRSSMINLQNLVNRVGPLLPIVTIMCCIPPTDASEITIAPRVTLDTGLSSVSLLITATWLIRHLQSSKVRTKMNSYFGTATGLLIITFLSCITIVSGIPAATPSLAKIGHGMVAPFLLFIVMWLSLRYLITLLLRLFPKQLLKYYTQLDLHLYFLFCYQHYLPDIPLKKAIISNGAYTDHHHTTTKFCNSCVGFGHLDSECSAYTHPIFSYKKYYNIPTKQTIEAYLEVHTQNEIFIHNDITIIRGDLVFINKILKDYDHTTLGSLFPEDFPHLTVRRVDYTPVVNVDGTIRIFPNTKYYNHTEYTLDKESDIDIAHYQTIYRQTTPFKIGYDIPCGIIPHADTTIVHTHGYANGHIEIDTSSAYSDITNLSLRPSTASFSCSMSSATSQTGSITSNSSSISASSANSLAQKSTKDQVFNYMSIRPRRIYDPSNDITVGILTATLRPNDVHSDALYPVELQYAFPGWTADEIINDENGINMHEYTSCRQETKDFLNMIDPHKFSSHVKSSTTPSFVTLHNGCIWNTSDSIIDIGIASANRPDGVSQRIPDMVNAYNVPPPARRLGSYTKSGRVYCIWGARVNSAPTPCKHVNACNCLDTKYHRYNAFYNAASTIISREQLTTVSLSLNVGCGPLQGDWNTYEQIIFRIANETQCYIRIYMNNETGAHHNPITNQTGKNRKKWHSYRVQETKLPINKTLRSVNVSQAQRRREQTRPAPPTILPPTPPQPDIQEDDEVPQNFVEHCQLFYKQRHDQLTNLFSLCLGIIIHQYIYDVMYGLRVIDHIEIFLMSIAFTTTIISLHNYKITSIPSTLAGILVGDNPVTWFCFLIAHKCKVSCSLQILGILNAINPYSAYTGTICLLVYTLSPSTCTSLVRFLLTLLLTVTGAQAQETEKKSDTHLFNQFTRLIVYALCAHIIYTIVKMLEPREEHETIQVSTTQSSNFTSTRRRTTTCAYTQPTTAAVVIVVALTFSLIISTASADQIFSRDPSHKFYSYYEPIESCDNPSYIGQIDYDRFWKMPSTFRFPNGMTLEDYLMEEVCYDDSILDLLQPVYVIDGINFEVTQSINCDHHLSVNKTQLTYCLEQRVSEKDMTLMTQAQLKKFALKYRRRADENNIISHTVQTVNIVGITLTYRSNHTYTLPYGSLTCNSEHAYCSYIAKVLGSEHTLPASALQYCHGNEEFCEYKRFDDADLCTLYYRDLTIAPDTDPEDFKLAQQFREHVASLCGIRASIHEAHIYEPKSTPKSRRGEWYSSTLRIANHRSRNGQCIVNVCGSVPADFTDQGIEFEYQFVNDCSPSNTTADCVAIDFAYEFAYSYIHKKVMHNGHVPYISRIVNLIPGIPEAYTRLAAVYNAVVNIPSEEIVDRLYEQFDNTAQLATRRLENIKYVPKIAKMTAEVLFADRIVKKYTLVGIRTLCLARFEESVCKKLIIAVNGFINNDHLIIETDFDKATFTALYHFITKHYKVKYTAPQPVCKFVKNLTPTQRYINDCDVQVELKRCHINFVEGQVDYSRRNVTIIHNIPTSQIDVIFTATGTEYYDSNGHQFAAITDKRFTVNATTYTLPSDLKLMAQGKNKQSRHWHNYGHRFYNAELIKPGTNRGHMIPSFLGGPAVYANAFLQTIQANLDDTPFENQAIGVPYNKHITSYNPNDIIIGDVSDPWCHINPSTQSTPSLPLPHNVSEAETFILTHDNIFTVTHDHPYHTEDEFKLLRSLALPCGVYSYTISLRGEVVRRWNPSDQTGGKTLLHHPVNTTHIRTWELTTTVLKTALSTIAKLRHPVLQTLGLETEFVTSAHPLHIRNTLGSMYTYKHLSYLLPIALRCASGVAVNFGINTPLSNCTLDNGHGIEQSGLPSLEHNIQNFTALNTNIPTTYTLSGDTRDMTCLYNAIRLWADANDYTTSFTDNADITFRFDNTVLPTRCYNYNIPSTHACDSPTYDIPAEDLTYFQQASLAVICREHSNMYCHQLDIDSYPRPSYSEFMDNLIPLTCGTFNATDSVLRCATEYQIIYTPPQEYNTTLEQFRIANMHCPIYIEPTPGILNSSRGIYTYSYQGRVIGSSERIGTTRLPSDILILYKNITEVKFNTGTKLCQSEGNNTLFHNGCNLKVTHGKPASPIYTTYPDRRHDIIQAQLTQDILNTIINATGNLNIMKYRRSTLNLTFPYHPVDINIEQIDGCHVIDEAALEQYNRDYQIVYEQPELDGILEITVPNNFAKEKFYRKVLGHCYQLRFIYTDKVINVDPDHTVNNCLYLTKIADIQVSGSFCNYFLPFKFYTTSNERCHNYVSNLMEIYGVRGVDLPFGFLDKVECSNIEDTKIEIISDKWGNNTYIHPGAARDTWGHNVIMNEYTTEGELLKSQVYNQSYFTFLGGRVHRDNTYCLARPYDTTSVYIAPICSSSSNSRWSLIYNIPITYFRHAQTSYYDTLDHSSVYSLIIIIVSYYLLTRFFEPVTVCFIYILITNVFALIIYQSRDLAYISSVISMLFGTLTEILKRCMVIPTVLSFLFTMTSYCKKGSMMKRPRDHFDMFVATSFMAFSLINIGYIFLLTGIVIFIGLYKFIVAQFTQPHWRTYVNVAVSIDDIAALGYTQTNQVRKAADDLMKKSTDDKYSYYQQLDFFVHAAFLNAYAQAIDSKIPLNFTHRNLNFRVSQPKTNFLVGLVTHEVNTGNNTRVEDLNKHPYNKYRSNIVRVYGERGDLNGFLSGKFLYFPRHIFDSCTDNTLTRHIRVTKGEETHDIELLSEEYDATPFIKIGSPFAEATVLKFGKLQRTQYAYFVTADDIRVGSMSADGYHNISTKDGDCGSLLFDHLHNVVGAHIVGIASIPPVNGALTWNAEKEMLCGPNDDYDYDPGKVGPPRVWPVESITALSTILNQLNYVTGDAFTTPKLPTNYQLIGCETLDQYVNARNLVTGQFPQIKEALDDFINGYVANLQRGTEAYNVIYTSMNAQIRIADLSPLSNSITNWQYLIDPLTRFRCFILGLLKQYLRHLIIYFLLQIAFICFDHGFFFRVLRDPTHFLFSIISTVFISVSPLASTNDILFKYLLSYTLEYRFAYLNVETLIQSYLYLSSREAIFYTSRRVNKLCTVFTVIVMLLIDTFFVEIGGYNVLPILIICIPIFYLRTVMMGAAQIQVYFEADLHKPAANFMTLIYFLIINAISIIIYCWGLFAFNVHANNILFATTIVHFIAFYVLSQEVQKVFEANTFRVPRLIYVAISYISHVLCHIYSAALNKVCEWILQIIINANRLVLIGSGSFGIFLTICFLFYFFKQRSNMAKHESNDIAEAHTHFDSFAKLTTLIANNPKLACMKPFCVDYNDNRARMTLKEKGNWVVKVRDALLTQFSLTNPADLDEVIHECASHPTLNKLFFDSPKGLKVYHEIDSKLDQVPYNGENGQIKSDTAVLAEYRNELSLIEWKIVTLQKELAEAKAAEERDAIKGINTHLADLMKQRKTLITLSNTLNQSIMARDAQERRVARRHANEEANEIARVIKAQRLRDSLTLIFNTFINNLIKLTSDCNALKSYADNVLKYVPEETKDFLKRADNCYRLSQDMILIETPASPLSYFKEKNGIIEVINSCSYDTFKDGMVVNHILDGTTKLPYTLDSLKSSTHVVCYEPDRSSSYTDTCKHELNSKVGQTLPCGKSLECNHSHYHNQFDCTSGYFAFMAQHITECETCLDTFKRGQCGCGYRYKVPRVLQSFILHGSKCSLVTHELSYSGTAAAFKPYYDEATHSIMYKSAVIAYLKKPDTYTSTFTYNNETYYLPVPLTHDVVSILIAFATRNGSIPVSEVHFEACFDRVDVEEDSGLQSYSLIDTPCANDDQVCYQIQTCPFHTTKNDTCMICANIDDGIYSVVPADSSFHELARELSITLTNVTNPPPKRHEANFSDKASSSLPVNRYHYINSAPFNYTITNSSPGDGWVEFTGDNHEACVGHKIWAKKYYHTSGIFCKPRASSSTLIINGKNRHYKTKHSLKREIKTAQALSHIPEAVQFHKDEHGYYREISQFSLADVLHGFANQIEPDFLAKYTNERNITVSNVTWLCKNICNHKSCNILKMDIFDYTYTCYTKAQSFALQACTIYNFDITPDNICPEGVYDFETYRPGNCDPIKALNAVTYCIERHWFSAGLSLSCASIYPHEDMTIHQYKEAFALYTTELNTEVTLKHQPTFDSYLNFMLVTERHNINIDIGTGADTFYTSFDNITSAPCTEERYNEVMAGVTRLYYAYQYDRGDFPCKYTVTQTHVKYPVIGDVAVEPEECKNPICNSYPPVYSALISIQKFSTWARLMCHDILKRVFNHCRDCDHLNCKISRQLMRFKNPLSNIQPVAYTKLHEDRHLIRDRLTHMDFTSGQEFYATEFINEFNDVEFKTLNGDTIHFNLTHPYDALLEPLLPPNTLVGNSVAASGVISDLDANFKNYDRNTGMSCSLTEFQLSLSHILYRSEAQRTPDDFLDITPYEDTKKPASKKSSGIGITKLPQGYVRSLSDYTSFIRSQIEHIKHHFSIWLFEVIPKISIQPVDKALRSIFIGPAFMNDVYRCFNTAWLEFTKTRLSYNTVLIGFKDTHCGINKLINGIKAGFNPKGKAKWISQDYPKFDTCVDTMAQYSYIMNHAYHYTHTNLSLITRGLCQLIANSTSPIIYYNSMLIRKLHGVSSGDGATAIKNSHCNSIITNIAFYRQIIDKQVPEEYRGLQSTLYNTLINGIQSKDDAYSTHRAFEWNISRCATLSDDTLAIINPDVFDLDQYLSSYRTLGGYEITNEKKIFVRDEPYEFTSRYFFKEDGFWYNAPLIERVFSSIVQCSKSTSLCPEIMGGRLLSILINAWPLTRKNDTLNGVPVKDIVMALYKITKNYIDKHNIFYTTALVDFDFDDERISNIGRAAVDHIGHTKKFIDIEYLDNVWFKQPEMDLAVCHESKPHSSTLEHYPNHEYISVPSNVETIIGDITTITDGITIQAVSRTGKKPHGLSASFAAQGRNAYNVAHKSRTSYTVDGNVRHIWALSYPGKAIDDYDEQLVRLHRLIASLSAIIHTENPTRIYIPWKILCGLGGGNWSMVYQALTTFAKFNKDITFTFVRLDSTHEGMRDVCFACGGYGQFECYTCASAGYPFTFCNGATCLRTHITDCEHYSYSLAARKRYIIQCSECEEMDIRKMYVDNDFRCAQHLDKEGYSKITDDKNNVTIFRTNATRSELPGVSKILKQVEKKSFFKIIYEFTLKHWIQHNILLSFIAAREDMPSEVIDFKVIKQVGDKTYIKTDKFFSFKINNKYIDATTLQDISLKQEYTNGKLSLYIDGGIKKGIKNIRITTPNPSNSLTLWNTITPTTTVLNIFRGIQFQASTFYIDNTGSLLDKMANNNITVIQGPPGTGKTYTINKFLARINEILPNSNIAVLASSHSAVDNIGNSVNPSIFRRCKRLIPQESEDKVRTRFQRYTTGGGIIFATLQSTRGILCPSVEYMIIDEFSMATDIQIYSAICHLNPRHVIFTGDPCQLSTQHVYNTDVYHSNIINNHQLTGKFPTEFLDITYRMGSKINDFISENFYYGKLKTAATYEGEVFQLHLDPINMLSQIHAIWESSPQNNFAILVTHHEAFSIIRQYFTDLDIQIPIYTVHTSQGRTFDRGIVVSYRNTAFTKDPNIVNVAVSRFRFQCICMHQGNPYYAKLPYYNTSQIYFEKSTTVIAYNGPQNKLSNMYTDNIKPFPYHTLENRYQSEKAKYLGKKLILHNNPFETLKEAKKVFTREDNLRWAKVSAEVMTRLLFEKFNNPDLAKHLINTGKSHLVENTKHPIWGGKGGENLHGKILTNIRTKLEVREREPTLIDTSYKHNVIFQKFKNQIISAPRLDIHENTLCIDVETVNSKDIKGTDNKSLHFPSQIGFAYNGTIETYDCTPTLTVNGHSITTKYFNSIYPSSVKAAKRGKHKIEFILRSYMARLQHTVTDQITLVFKSALIDVSMIHNAIRNGPNKCHNEDCANHPIWYTEHPCCAVHVDGIIQAFYNPYMVDIHGFTCPRCTSDEFTYSPSEHSIDCNRCYPSDNNIYNSRMKLQVMHDTVCNEKHGAAHDSGADAAMTLCIYNKIESTHHRKESLSRRGRFIKNQLLSANLHEIRKIKTYLENEYNTQQDFYIGGGTYIPRTRNADIRVGTSANEHFSYCTGQIHKHIYIDSRYYVDIDKDKAHCIFLDRSNPHTNNWKQIHGLHYTLDSRFIYFSPYGAYNGPRESLPFPLLNHKCEGDKVYYSSSRQYNLPCSEKPRSVLGSFYYHCCESHALAIEEIDNAFSTAPGLELWQKPKVNHELYHVAPTPNTTTADILTNGELLLPGYEDRPFKATDTTLKGIACIQTLSKFNIVPENTLLLGAARRDGHCPFIQHIPGKVTSVDLVRHENPKGPAYAIDLCNELPPGKFDTIISDLYSANPETLFPRFKDILSNNLKEHGHFLFKVTNKFRHNTVIEEIAQHFSYTHIYKAPTNTVTSELWVANINYNPKGNTGNIIDFDREYAGRIKTMIDNPHKFKMLFTSPRFIKFT